ncbi:MAG: glycosyltransferase family 39 protein [bacterium]|nr:glycosyltransferase family 39 protein [bacterium]
MYQIREFIEQYREILYPSLIAIAVIVSFYGILFNSFAYDDDFGILLNANIIENNSISTFFLNPNYLFYSEHAPGTYRPLALWLTSLEIRLVGVDPFNFHLVSLVLHLTNAILAFYLLRMLFKSSAVALTIALLWGIHPVQTEAVAWAFQQSTLVSFMFMTLSLMTALIASRKDSRIFYVTSLILGLIAMLTKSQVLVLPVLLAVVLLYERVPWKKIAYMIIPFFMLVSVIMIARALVGVGTSQVTAEFSKIHLSLIMIKAFANYIILMFWPNPLTVDYDTFLKVAPSFFWSATLLIYTAALFFVASRTNRAITLGIFWFFIGLAPVSNVVFLMTQFMNERFLYLPSLGFLIAIIFFLKVLYEAIQERNKLIAQVLSVLFISSTIISFTYFSVERVKDWKSPLSLWESAYQVNPLGLRTRVLYADALFASDKTKLAFTHYIGLANELDLTYWPSLAYSTLKVSIELDEIYRGNAIGKSILKKYPNSELIFYAYGQFLLKSKQYAKAENYWELMLTKFPVRSSSVFYLAYSKYAQDRNTNLETTTHILLDKDFKRKIPQLLEGFNFLEEHQYVKAVSVLQPLLENQDILPIVEPYEWLAEAYEHTGNIDRALATYYQLLRLNSKSPDYFRATKRLLNQ